MQIHLREKVGIPPVSSPCFSKKTREGPSPVLSKLPLKSVHPVNSKLDMHAGWISVPQGRAACASRGDCVPQGVCNASVWQELQAVASWDRGCGWAEL